MNGVRKMVLKTILKRIYFKKENMNTLKFAKTKKG